MSIFAAFKHIIPEFHAYSDDSNRYNLGATWTAADGLKDYHNVEFRYVRNSERLALEGEPQPDGTERHQRQAERDEAAGFPITAPVARADEEAPDHAEHGDAEQQAD